MVQTKKGVLILEIYFIPIPLIGLTNAKSYKIIVELEQFRNGTIKDKNGNIKEYTHMFRANATDQVELINIPADGLPEPSKLVANYRLFEFDQENWKQLGGSSGRLSKTVSKFLKIKNDSPIIGANLELNVNKALDCYSDNREQPDEQDLLQTENKQLFETLEETKVKHSKLQADLDYLNSDLNEIEADIEKTKKIIKSKQELQTQIEEKQDQNKDLIQQLDAAKTANKQLQNEINQNHHANEMMQQTVDRQNEAYNHLVFLSEYMQDVATYKKIIQHRQEHDLQKVDDRRIKYVLMSKSFPEYLAKYNWKVDAKKEVLLKENISLVYALIGQDKESKDYLIKIGSSVDFESQSVIFDHGIKYKHFQPRSLVVVSDLFQTIDYDPYSTELLVRYVFEKKYGSTKRYKNEWFECTPETLKGLREVYDYFDTHLSHGGYLDKVICRGKLMNESNKNHFYDKCSKKIGKRIWPDLTQK